MKGRVYRRARLRPSALTISPLPTCSLGRFEKEYLLHSVFTGLRLRGFRKEEATGMLNSESNYENFFIRLNHNPLVRTADLKAGHALRFTR
jgi:hypothetical protein